MLGYLTDHSPRNHNIVLHYLNSGRVNARYISGNYLHQQVISPIEQPYEVLRSIYSTLPDHLIINGLMVNFISFQQIADMLNQGQIERYIIDPLLQPWAQEPYKILTFFSKNGMTYLAKVKYDQVSNQILP